MRKHLYFTIITAALALSCLCVAVAAEAGAVRAWGSRIEGQLGDGLSAYRYNPTGVLGINDAVFLDADETFSLAVRADGSVWCWGYKFYVGNCTNIPNQKSGLADITEAAVGDEHAIALTSRGKVWSWGYNDRGQLGDGTTTARTTPAEIPGLKKIIAVAAGQDTSYALKVNGTVWFWGSGGGQSTNSSPVQISGLSDIVAISGGYSHLLALAGDGTVWGWGGNTLGQLGNGTTSYNPVPTQVTGLANVVSIAAGDWHSLAALSDGTAWAWGSNESGVLGTETVPVGGISTLPVQIATITGVAKVTAGSEHSLAVLTDGTVRAWGDNGSWQIGDETLFSSSTPIPVPDLAGIASAAAGEFHSLALAADGGVWSWGRNTSGQLGDGVPVGATDAVAVLNLSDATAVEAGRQHTVGLAADGSVWTWGSNAYGKLGLGTSYHRSAVPVQVTSLGTAIAVSAGDNHTLAVTADGAVWAWGSNYSNQLGSGLPVTESAVPVAVAGSLPPISSVSAGGLQSIALAADGTVYWWGMYMFFDGIVEEDLPVQVPGLSGVVAVSAGDDHNLAIRNDGTVWAWGNNEFGGLGNGTIGGESLTPVQVQDLSGAVAVSAGTWGNSLALTSGRTVWGWGYDFARVEPVPAPIPEMTDAVGIACDFGSNNSYLKSDGTVWKYFSPPPGQLIQVPGVENATAVFAGQNYALAIVDAPVCTDVDADTFSPDGGTCGAVDCDDLEPAAFPGNPEVCDDGIDNDCDTFFDTDDSECPSACNNNGICEAGEDCTTCASDCAGKLKGKASARYCCGNGVPEAAEGNGAVCDGNY